MLDNTIRKLAKQIEMQNTFSACKELPSLKLFENDKNLSRIQQIFLSYLFFYYNINMDIALKKVSEKILNSNTYEDAYSYYKREKVEETKGKKERDIHLVFPKKNKKRK
jgi:hypothetical protein